MFLGGFHQNTEIYPDMPFCDKSRLSQVDSYLQNKIPLMC